MALETIGPYRILEELGRGAMGVVFRGFDPAIDRHVAIKIIQASQFASPEERAELRLRFAREAAAAGKLSHPNIVTIHQLGEHGDLQYLVLELIDGCSLEKILAGGQPQDPDSAVSTLTQVADALDYAHRQGVVHRDVKPANILIRADGMAKITDFGIARIASQTVTRTGATFGTPSYMSPEQIQTASVSGKADQYSLGVIAYQMLSGKKPFNAETAPALMFQIMSEEPPALHSVNPAISERTSEVIGKALAKKAEGRFANCLEFAQELAESLEPAGGQAGSSRKTVVKPISRTSGLRVPVGPAPEEVPREAAARTPTPKPRLGIWVAAGVAALALAGAAWMWWPRTAERGAIRAFPLGDRGVDAKGALPAGSPGQTMAGAPAARVNPKDGLPYVWIPPGTFRMGCSEDDGDCFDEENPAHPVTISRGFWMGQTEVTQSAYERLMRTNPSRFKGAQLPVLDLGWSEANAYCQAAGMRLPTEAEWEYAARAGNSGSRYGDTDAIAWYGGNSGDKPHQAGGKQPNPWGLYDMLGNVWEWVADWYADQYLPGSSTDPQGPPNGTMRTLRGGAWGVNPRNLRASMRLGNSLTQHNFDQYFGVRCAGN